MKYGTTDRCTDGTASANGNTTSYEPAKAFDNVYTADINGWISANTALPHWIKYDFGAGVTWEISQVKISSPTTTTQPQYLPKTFTIEGSNNDSDWDVLNTQTNIANWAQNETRTFSFVNRTKYRYIKINITNTEDGGNYAQIVEIEMFEGIYVAGGFSGVSSDFWTFMRDMWEEHNKIFRPKRGILIPGLT